jgi:hypothetical protein
VLALKSTEEDLCLGLTTTNADNVLDRLQDVQFDTHYAVVQVHIKHATVDIAMLATDVAHGSQGPELVQAFQVAVASSQPTGDLGH